MSKSSKDMKPRDSSNLVSRNDQIKRVAMILAAIIGLFLVFKLLTQEPDNGPVLSDIEASERLRQASSRNPSDKESFESLSEQVQGQAQAVDIATSEMKKMQMEMADKFDDVLSSMSEVRSAVQNQADIEEIAILKDEISRLKKDFKNLSNSNIQLGGSTSEGLSDVRRGQGGLTLPPTTWGRLDNRSGGLSAPYDESVREVVILDLGGEAELESNILDDVEKDINGNLSDAVEPDIFATKDYVPPNAFAPATVLVGVDAATGQRAQNDPLNATFLITGSARHVVKNGVMEQTDLEGCVVNGAAFGDLSSERVFIKLAKMTCPLPNGQVAVQDVQGHVTENGKAGVRGQIISRVGDKINRAAVAGLFSGLGGALGNAGQQSLSVSGSGGGIVQDIPNAEELAIASVGTGVANAASTLTQYYVERARAIEPVVSMPRGIDVELVFISGFKPRPSGKG